MGEPFSAREIEVLRLAADGLSNEEIAQVLGLAPSTIDWYTANLFARLGARNRTPGDRPRPRAGHPPA